MNESIVTFEKIFFTWLVRVMAAAVLVGSAWIDDAPPLAIGALVLLGLSFLVVAIFVERLAMLVVDGI